MVILVICSYNQLLQLNTKTKQIDSAIIHFPKQKSWQVLPATTTYGLHMDSVCVVYTSIYHIISSHINISRHILSYLHINLTLFNSSRKCPFLLLEKKDNVESWT